MGNRFLTATLSLAFACVLQHVTFGNESTSQPTTAPAAGPSTAPAMPIKIALAEFVKRRSEPDTIVLDMRTPAEFAKGMSPAR